MLPSQGAEIATKPFKYVNLHQEQDFIQPWQPCIQPETA